MTDFLERLSAALAGRYRLERELGAGGMATVYLARDLRHDRWVALKLLRSELAAVIGAERFLQEIRTTANLQHPHILGLIDSGETEHQLWYVMPFVEGESLRDRLNREKQLPVHEAVRLMVEVAGALDYAHRRGVIHRDIKPENILLHDGRALVADFGIALAASTAGGKRLTGTGLSLGTPAYMSPEQAMGEATITARSDVYALGCVLYELLAGAPPFTGPTSQAVVASMLTSEAPSLSAQRKTIPPHVEAAVLHALEKLPADRFDTAAEFAAALQNPSFALAAVKPGDRARRLGPATLLPWALLAAAVGLIVFDQLRPRPLAAPSPVYRFNVMLPETAAWANDFTSKPALSPDGTLLVYNGRDSTGQPRLFLRAMDRLEPSPIPGSEGGSLPFFAPDGRWIAFGLGTRFVKVPVSGGPAQTICETGGLSRGTWLERGEIVFADRTGLKQCSMTGEVTVLSASRAGEVFHHPEALPADRAVLFSIQRGTASQLAVLDLRSKTVHDLGSPGSDARYVETGHLVYVGPDERIHAVPFDPVKLRIIGEPVPIDERVQVEIGEAAMAVSRSGTTVTMGVAEQALVLVDRTGRAERLYAQTGDYRDPRLSPDGRRVAVRLGNSIWVLDRAQGLLTRLSFDSTASRPVWSSDGKRVAYVRERGTRVDLRVINADGSTPAESLLALPDKELWEVSFTPGRSLVLRTVGGEGRRDLWLWAPDSASRITSLVTTPANEVSPAVSPNGRWLAYASDESGRTEIYVRSFPGMGGKVQVSLNGGTEPVWSPAGDELFYRNGPVLMAALVRTAAGVEVARRTTLFSDGSYATDLTHQMYDVTPDKRFVMVRRLENTSFLTVTLHRFEHLGRGQ